MKHQTGSAPYPSTRWQLRPAAVVVAALNVLGSLGLAGSGEARADDAARVRFGGFIDTYYAYDFSRPPQIDRAFTTQPARQNEFNINLAYVEATLEQDRMRGRLALQAGTSVQSNYAGEPRVGQMSGPELARNLQEAVVGYRLGAQTWIDAGVMLSHIGLESFISKDNLTYTRSLVADYSPYYQAGVRLSTQLTSQLSAQLLVLNGWQTISENNSSKSIGTQLSYSPSSEVTLTYNTIFGQEASFRHFHDLVLKYLPSDRWTLAAQFDLGFQRAAVGGDDARWFGFTLIAKRALNRVVSVVARAERYKDPQQVLIAASNGAPFSVWGGSLGVDTSLTSRVGWRNEVRTLWSRDAVFPSGAGFSRDATVVVSSLSVAF